MRVRILVGVLLTAIALITAAARSQHRYNLPPAQQLLESGPGVGGPGPGVLAPITHHMPAALPQGQASAQLLFARPASMQVRWDVGGAGMFDSTPLILPGRQDFPQGGVYRLKLTNIPGREGTELYPTVEVAPSTPRTGAFLAHNAVPIQFTEEDFAQVLSGNFVTKVIYLPDPEFQNLAVAGVDTLVSTRLDPGQNPIKEADRRGAIMAVIRLGNKDIELPGAGGNTGVQPVTFRTPALPHAATPSPLGQTGLMPKYLAGVTAPQYGMPMGPTPIGLPGPPHIPFGNPAGLGMHQMKNHTKIFIPQPTKNFVTHVRQQPGMSYPTPPNRVWIREQSIHPPQYYGMPHWMYNHKVK